MNSKLLTFCIDLGVTGALGLALLLVVGIDSLLAYLHPATEAPQVAAVDSPLVKTKLTPKRLRLAVTRPYTENVFGNDRATWDDIGAVLRSLGEGYGQYQTIDEETLRDAGKLKDYDVVFCCCSAVETDPVAAVALREYVLQGGTLYASDWRYGLVARAFPEINPAPEHPLPGQSITGPDGVKRPITEPNGLVTPKGNVLAEVLDEGLRSTLDSSTVLLNFEMPLWKPALFQEDRVNILLRFNTNVVAGTKFNADTGDRGGASFEAAGNMPSSKLSVPLLVRFTFGKGTAIFTSYHHGKNSSETEKKVLKYLIFKLVTANVETDIEDVLNKSQFSPVKSNLFSASKEDPSITKTYNNPQPGKLRFDLAFQEAGAELKLEVISPNGKKIEKQGTSSFFIEVPNAETGNWQYVVTALHVPYENFAFQARVSHGKQ